MKPIERIARRTERGFTLLEVLIAVAIFVIVGMLAMTGYNELMSQSERVEESAARTRAVQSAMMRISQDFALLEPRAVRPALGQEVVPALRAAAAPVIVFSGHVHGFEYLVRDGVHHVTTAGGGGPRGPLAEQKPDDRYRGPDCRREKQGDVVRPLNYLLLRASAATIEIEVRGLCGGGDGVRELDRIEVPR